MNSEFSEVRLQTLQLLSLDSNLHVATSVTHGVAEALHWNASHVANERLLFVEEAMRSVSREQQEEPLESDELHARNPDTLASARVHFVTPMP